MAIINIDEKHFSPGKWKGKSTTNIKIENGLKICDISAINRPTFL